MRYAGVLPVLVVLALPLPAPAQETVQPPRSSVTVTPFVGHAFVPPAAGFLHVQENFWDLPPARFRSRSSSLQPVGGTVELRLTRMFEVRVSAAYASRGEGSIVLGSTQQMELRHRDRDVWEVPRSGGTTWLAGAGLSMVVPARFPIRVTVGPALIHERPAPEQDPTLGWPDRILEAATRPVTHPALRMGVETAVPTGVHGLEVRVGIDDHVTGWNDEELASTGIAPFTLREGYEYSGTLDTRYGHIFLLRAGLAYGVPW